MPEPIRSTNLTTDLTPRFVTTTTVGASPSAASETIIATLTIPNFLDIPVVSGIFLTGWAAYTVGGSGVSANLKIRQTNVSGTTVAATGVLNKTAASLYADDVNGYDTSPPTGGVYVLTMTVASAVSASTVSALLLTAIVI